MKGLMHQRIQLAGSRISMAKIASWILFIMGISTGSLAASKTPDIILYTIDYPPYTIVSGNKVNGIDVDVVKAAFSEVSINAEIQAAPWKRILKNIEHGRVVGTISCSRRLDRETFMIFSDPISEILQVAVMSEQVDDRSINERIDLKAYSVLAVEGWGVEKELTNNQIEYSTTPSMDSGLNAVVYRGAGVFYTGELVTKYRARQLGLLDKIKIKRLDDVMPNKLHLCLSRDYPGNEQLLTEFNKGLKAIMENGRYQKIYDRYLLKK